MGQSPLGILLVSEVYPPAIGGSGVLLENLYSRLADRPVRVLTEGQDPVRIQGGLEVHSVAMTTDDWGVFRPSALARHLRVARTINRLGPTPQDIHCAKALPEGLSARLALWSRPGVYACWLHGEELGFASSSRELTRLARWVYHGAAAVFANSSNSRRLLLEQWGVPAERVHVIHPGVDTEAFCPGLDGRTLRSRVASPEDILFLSVGRLQRRKGHDMVLRALARLRVSMPNVRYAVVGGGEHADVLQKDVSDLGLGDIVHFIGSADQADIPAWYAACDVFVMPNRTDGVDFEGFGIVFLEAAASGKPVIGGRSGGVPEAVEDGVTGTLVSGEDVAELAAAMADLATAPDKRRRMGEAGRLRACAGFTWAASAERLRTLVRESESATIRQ